MSTPNFFQLTVHNETDGWDTHARARTQTHAHTHKCNILFHDHRCIENIFLFIPWSPCVETCKCCGSSAPPARGCRRSRCRLLPRSVWRGSCHPAEARNPVRLSIHSNVSNQAQSAHFSAGGIIEEVAVIPTVGHGNRGTGWWSPTPSIQQLDLLSSLQSLPNTGRQSRRVHI